jgi:hypothetical protein
MGHGKHGLPAVETDRLADLFRDNEVGAGQGP